MHDLWTANLSPLLDPLNYCRKSAFFGGTPTRNGTAAARRLLEGKQKVVDELRDEILGRAPRKPRPYAVVGHGVPKQLLQAHVDMASLLLIQHKHAAAVSFKNFDGDLSLERLIVRSAGGVNRAEPFPPADPDNVDWEYQMELYLTVMTRMTSVLSDILWPDNPIPEENEEEDDDDFVRSSTMSVAKPCRWNVELLRGTGNPSISMLTPIVEWTPPEGDSKLGQMCIQLRGLPTAPHPKPSNKRRQKPVEVTLIFRAFFQNPMK